MAHLSNRPIGPLIGGFTYESLGWRWLYYLQLIVTGALYVAVSVIFLVARPISFYFILLQGNETDVCR